MLPYFIITINETELMKYLSFSIVMGTSIYFCDITI